MNLKFTTDLKPFLAQKIPFLIVIPIPHDVDGLTSSLALAKFCQKQQFQFQLISQKPLADFFYPLVKNYQIKTKWPEQDEPYLICLADTPTLKNTGFKLEIENSQWPILVIDHHPLADIHKKAKVLITNSRWSSTTQGLYYIFKELNVLDAKIATLLYLGIIADSGSFQYNLQPETFQVSAHLLSLGADRFFISNFLNQNKRQTPQLRLWGIASTRLKTIESWNLNYTWLSQEDFQLTQTNYHHSLGLVNFLANQNLTPVTLLLIEADNQIKGFIRSTDRSISAQKIAQIFGGSGQKNAAGFILSGKFAKKDGLIKIVNGN